MWNERQIRQFPGPKAAFRKSTPPVVTAFQAHGLCHCPGHLFFCQGLLQSPPWHTKSFHIWTGSTQGVKSQTKNTGSGWDFFYWWDFMLTSCTEDSFKTAILAPQAIKLFKGEIKREKCWKQECWITEFGTNRQSAWIIRIKPRALVLHGCVAPVKELILND